MAAIAAKGKRRGVDGLHGAHGIALDARNLHQAGDRIAAHAQMMLDADLSGILDLRVAAAERGGKSRRGHRTGDANLALATDLGARQGRVALAQAANRGRSQEEADNALFVGFLVELTIVANDRRDDSRGTVGRRGHYSAPGGVLLIDGDRICAGPIDRLGRIADVLRALVTQRVAERLRPPSHVEAAGEDAFAAHAAVDAGVHDSPAFEQAGANLIGAGKRRSFSSWKRIGCRPSSESICCSRMRCTMGSTCSESIRSGTSPERPSRIARSVLCPRPVKASDP